MSGDEANVLKKVGDDELDDWLAAWILAASLGVVHANKPWSGTNGYSALDAQVNQFNLFSCLY